VSRPPSSRVGATIVRSSGSVARRAPAVVLCALATHAAVYHSLEPADAAHGYFSWYAPLVTVLSLLALLGVPLVLGLLLLGRPSSRVRRVATSVLPATSAAGGQCGGGAVIALASFAFLFGQESLERSLQLHAAALPSFSAPEWLLLVAAVVALSHAFVWAGRGVTALLGVIRSPSRPGRWPKVRRLRSPGAAVTLQRSSPLALHAALRAPPALP
jgi:hypothetical protein